MRILFLAPWFRTLAWSWARELSQSGRTTMVVTTNNHFESGPARDGEFVLANSPRSVAGARELLELRRAVARFAPDVLVTEGFRDPRLLAVIGDKPLLWMIHDADPHDPTHIVPFQRRVFERAMLPRVTAILAFSQAVATTLRPRYPRMPIHVLPLPSEMPDDLVPPLVEADRRRDFYAIGRIKPYKNLAAVAQAWKQHVASAAYRGDTLRIIGAGELDSPLPPEATWHNEEFAFADLAPQLAAGKGSLSFYLTGSQSGVQILSMQVGCPTIVSAVGGLAEYQPADLPALHPGDVPGLVSHLSRLSDPQYATLLGAASAAEYRDRFAAPVSAARLADVLDLVVRSRI